MDIHDWIILIDIHVRIMDIHNINNWLMDSLDRRMDIDYRAFISAFPWYGRSTCLRFGCLNVLGPSSSDDFHSMMKSSNWNIFRVTGPLCGEFTCHRWIPLTKASDMELWCFLWSATEQTFKQTIKTPVISDAIALIMTITVMHISSVIKISFCRISFSGHQNKFCACLDSIYGSRVILVMCKNCSDISWHQLNLNQSKTNCPKNLNSDGLIVREMGPWPECIFRSLLQFLVKNILNSSPLMRTQLREHY